jgi:benzoyl-CoA reductase/2-hydroxyglutaryl-CoA dehydratase subunit BcrC/BadD/HgdB
MKNQNKLKQQIFVELVKCFKANYNEINNLRDSIDKVVWVNGGIPGFYYSAFDLIPFFPQNLMFNKDEFLQNVEILAGKYEIPDDICSEIKISLARCLIPSKSRLHIPEPNLIISSNLLCSQIMKSFDFISQVKNVPYFPIEIPFIDSVKIDNDPVYKDQILKYLKNQFDSLNDLILSKFGHSFDEERFRSGANIYFQISFLFERILKFNSSMPAPIDGQDFFNYSLPIWTCNYFSDQVDLLDFYIKIYNSTYKICEMNKKDNAKPEKIRVFWDGQFFPQKNRMIKEVFRNYNAKIVCGSYVYPYVNSIDEINEILPYPLTKETLENQFHKSEILRKKFSIYNLNSLSCSEIMACIMLDLSCHKFGIAYRKKLIKKVLDIFSIDAVIVSMSQNCRFWSMIQQGVMKSINDESKMPYLPILADSTDERYISEAQLINRIEPFFEKCLFNK